MMYCPRCKFGDKHHGFNSARYQDRSRSSYIAGLFKSGNVHDFCAIMLGDVRTHMGAYGYGRRVRTSRLHSESSGKEA